MSTNSKIFIASRSVLFPNSKVDTGRDHLYLVYDRDGDPRTTGDQYVIRGGPEGEGTSNPNGRIKLEINKPVADSFDAFKPETGLTPESRNYTALTLPAGKTADQVWAQLMSDAQSMGNGERDEFGRWITDVPYTLPYVDDSTNSNSTIATLLATQGLDIYANLPREGGTGARIDAEAFPGVENIFATGASDETISVTDSRVERVVDYGSGDTTIRIDAGRVGNATDGSPLEIWGDNDPRSTDKIVLDGIDPGTLRFQKSGDGNLYIFFPGNNALPSIALAGQFAGGMPKFAVLEVIGPDGRITRIPINDEGAFSSLSPILQPIAKFIAELIGVFTGMLTKPVSPLILDLDGDGVELTALSGTGAAPVYWDIDNDGFGEASAWVKSDDGLLALDKNGNGKIDNHAELFGTSTKDGFSVLKALDTNKDGRISAADADFAKLRVWRDLNQDGVSQANELFTLAKLGIASINVNAAKVDYSIAGNKVTHEASYTLTNGATRTIVDAWFNFDNVNSVYKGDYTLDPRTAFLPQLRGYGVLPDLAIAMSLKPVLLDKVAAFQSLDLVANAATVLAKVQEIMHYWAGAEAIGVNSRGAGINARDVKFVEKLFDKLATDRPNDYIGGGERGYAVEAIFHDLQLHIAARLLLQGAGQQFFITAPQYNPVSDEFSGGYTLNFTALNAMGDGKPFATVFYQWVNVLTMIEGSVGLSGMDSATRTALNNAIKASDATGFLDFDVVAANLYGFGRIQLGGTGDDEFAGDSRADLVFGGNGNDTLEGGGGNDALYGGAGNDRLDGGGGIDRIFGGAGNDTIVVRDQDAALGPELLDGGTGTNTLLAERADLSKAVLKSFTTLSVYESATLTAAQLGLFSRIQVAEGGTAALQAASAGTYRLDTRTVAGTFHLLGSAGNDTLIGNGASQDLNGNDGNDTLYGRAGNDTLNGGAGNDILYGEDGNDILYGGGGIDRLYGGNGNDILYADCAAGSILDGGAGTNILRGQDLSGLKLANFTRLEVDLSVVLTAAQLALFSQIKAGYSGHGEIGAAAAGTYSLDGKTVTGIFDMYGSSGSDTLIGNAASQALWGNSGNDKLYGRAGNDTLNGEAGNDVLYGEDGNDTLFGGLGLDKLYGGAGNDILVADDVVAGEVYDGGAGTDTLRASADISRASIVSCEILETDWVKLTAAQFAGFGQIKGGFGEIHAASAGTYSLAGKTVAGTIDIYGSAGNDTLIGNAKGQTLSGDLGHDTLDGRGGADRLYGLEGNDTYLFGRGYGTDRIYETSGSDLLKLGAGIAKDQLWFAKSGSDLVISVIGSSDTITVNRWYDGTAMRVEKIQTADGHVLSHANVAKLVDAMDDLAMPTQSQLPASYHAQLDPLINQVWAHI
jgi:Ca2+-binding RTX toxin-like protein